ncbi:MAG: hypothetical protein H6Q12_29 [Bacteroidetes bacterium]|nr:hypothetical protein [Bacteroidota bacterium]
MIIYFAVTNFKSFKERVEFNMLAGNYKRFQEHIYSEQSLNLLRCSAMYGNNGAGKSNLILAMEKLQEIVKGVLEVENVDDLPYFKLDPICIDQPTVFEIEFFFHGIRYSYYISFLKGKIIEEWLVKVFQNNKTENIFNRTIKNNKTILVVGEKSKKTTTKELMRMEIYAEELSKKGNKPFLLDGFEKEVNGLIEPFLWFYFYLKIVRPGYSYPSKIKSFEDDNFKDKAKKILTSLCLGIDDIKIESVPLDDFLGKGDDIKSAKDEIDKSHFPKIVKKGKIEYSLYKNQKDEYVAAKIVTVHNQNVDFDFFEESTGTQKIIELLPSIISAIVEKDITYVFDEIETSKHPEVIKELLRIFLNAGNTHSGQIIFSTHECNLLDLDLLRQDEIWFAEKDQKGVSHIYSLSDFKPRFDKDIRKGYLEGQFTKIPFFTNPKELNWNE